METPISTLSPSRPLHSPQQALWAYTLAQLKFFKEGHDLRPEIDNGVHQLHDKSTMAEVGCFCATKKGLAWDYEELRQVQHSIWKCEMTLAGCACHMAGARILQRIEVINQSKLRMLMEEYKHRHCGCQSWEGGNVMFLVAPDFTTYADTLDCSILFFPSPHWSHVFITIGISSDNTILVVIYVQYNLAGLVLYDINLGATTMTSLSTRGVTIPINLVTSTTVLFTVYHSSIKPVPVAYSDLKSEFLCQLSKHCPWTYRPPEPPCTPGISPRPHNPVSFILPRTKCSYWVPQREASQATCQTS